MSVTTPSKQATGNVFEQVPSDIFNKLSSSLLELTTVQREFAVVKDQLAQAKVELEVILISILKKKKKEDNLKYRYPSHLFINNTMQKYGYLLWYF